MFSLDETPSLTRNLYSAQQIKQGEQVCAAELNIDMYQLMEKAGHAVFERILAYYPDARKILVVAGGGNNGGDAFIVARLALQSKFEVKVVVRDTQANWRGDAKIALQSFLSLGGELTTYDCQQDYRAQGYEVVIDGLLGIGITGTLKPSVVDIINHINAMQLPVIAVDLPSGLNSDTGCVDPVAIKAQFTVTFIVGKLGLFTGQGPDHSGKIVCAGLHISERFTEKYPPFATLNNKLFVPSIPARKLNTNKGSYGHVVCVGGNKGMAGAIYLSAKAALRSGAGKVSVFTHPDNVDVITILCPELMVFAWQQDDEYINSFLNEKISTADSLVFGPGLGNDSWAMSLFDLLITRQMNSTIPMVVDADGLNLMAKQPESIQVFRTLNTVITPHPLEASRLLASSVEVVNNNRKQFVEKLSQEFGCVSVLKGVGSLVCDGTQICVNRSGNPGMATAGMGDVLTGIIAALVIEKSQINASLYDKVRLAVFLHGLAGDFAAKNGEIGIIATDVVEHIPSAVSHLVS